MAGGARRGLKRRSHGSICPCCGSNYLTETELSMIVALYVAPGPKTVAEISGCTGGCQRNIRRTIMARRKWFSSVEAVEKHGAGYMRVARYSLSQDGLDVARRVVGA